ncbi:hypothetical protein, partial [Acinetobacter indicus]|uniref:hypothetical protein n=1 Tax=Acinetobacter indicus TaxID=756892 RepID=UPI00144463C1
MNILIHQYENFTMKGDESIKQMFERLNLIVDALEHLGKIYSNSEKVRKVLLILPKFWEAKKTTIEKANDISIIPLEQLMSSLMSYEMERTSQPDMRSTSVAFKAVKQPTEASDDDAEADSDDELAMIAKRLLRFASRKHLNKNRDGKMEKHHKQVDPKTVRCYECKKKGHF